jgi:hypothetical protein
MKQHWVLLEGTIMEGTVYGNITCTKPVEIAVEGRPYYMLRSTGNTIFYYSSEHDILYADRTDLKRYAWEIVAHKRRMRETAERQMVSI